MKEKEDLQTYIFYTPVYNHFRNRSTRSLLHPQQAPLVLLLQETLHTPTIRPKGRLVQQTHQVPFRGLVRLGDQRHRSTTMRDPPYRLHQRHTLAHRAKDETDRERTTGRDEEAGLAAAHEGGTEAEAELGQDEESFAGRDGEALPVEALPVAGVGLAVEEDGEGGVVGGHGGVEEVEVARW